MNRPTQNPAPSTYGASVTPYPHTRALGLLGAGLTLIISVSACTGDVDADAQPNTTTTTSSSTSTTAATAATDAPSAAHTKAVRMLQHWSQRELAYAQWWKQLKPYLSARGRQELAYTDPAQIPPLSINGRSSPRQSTPSFAVVRVPTTIGPFDVQLTRTETGPWLVGSMQFPPGIH